jgi:hypothetical protein
MTILIYLTSFFTYINLERDQIKPAVVDLPTPPFPEATAMMSLTPLIERPPLVAAL